MKQFYSTHKHFMAGKQISTISLLLFLFSLLQFLPIYAQEKCGSTVRNQELSLQKPSLIPVRRAGEVEAALNEQKIKAGAIVLPSIVTIPVVVHVVYHAAVENISDAQIQSQMEALNRDYRKLNADTTAIPTCWKSLASDIGFEFCLATKDPNGNDTNGVTRTYTAATSFGIDDAVKDTAKAWDPTRYLNIWVCNLGNSYFGYSQFPYDLKSMPNTDGCVINYFAFGQMGSAVSPSNLGRTTTHEVGHWFNLIHTWGDAYCGNDSIADTPPQTAAHFGCTAVFPDLSTACNPTTETNGTMYCNYMDYSDDPCLLLFTSDQKARMLSALVTYRPVILAQNNCTPIFAGIPSIANGLSDSDLKVYPNPNNGRATIGIGPGIKPIEITITNLIGQVVQRLDVRNNTLSTNTVSNATISLDLSKEPSGVYLVSVVTSTGKLVKKIIKSDM